MNFDISNLKKPDGLPIIRSKKPAGLPGLDELADSTPDEQKALIEACDSALEELRALSATMTTQALALLPVQAALVAGFAVALRKGDPGDLVEVLTFSGLAIAVMSSVFALIRVHDQTRYESRACKMRLFVLAEARRVAAKGAWSRVGVAATLVAAVLVVLCNIFVFTVKS